MRDNGSVTSQEYKLDPDTILMSTTDLNSHILYANAAFVDSSGYSRDELIDQPHNIVRHPDMPSAAFADMWATLKSGQPWTGLVKNRRKCGGFYWVRANAAPIKKGGEITGYVSVRTTPARAEIDQAARLYAKMRAGKVRWQKLHKGVLVYSGALSFLSLGQRMSTSARIWSVLAILATLLVVLEANSSAIAQLPFVVPCIVLSVIAGVVLNRQIAAPLKTILAQVSDVAAGKSPQAIDLNRTDELGLILRGVNQTGFNLQSLVSDVNDQIASLCDVTDSLSNDANVLKTQTQQADASLQQTASAVTQMTASLQHNATNAKQVAALSTKAHQGMGSGVQSVAEVVTMMDRIHDSSSRINELVVLIDSIAFQTNLLALNAAVEAARAGEAGKGFAVVALEVRNLSERSTQAAAEIRNVISESGKEVDEGAQLASNAGVSMQSLHKQMDELSTLIGGISTAVTEQSAGVSDINNSVIDLERVTSGNSRLVESSASAVMLLQARSHDLSQSVGRFTQA